MKKLVFLLALVCSTSALWAQSAVKFNETKHSFGKVKQDVPAVTEFTFKNTSKAPVIIETAAPSCGCTTPAYPKAPILPGKTGKIKVVYNSEAVGHFSKSVTVKFAKEEQPVILLIDGDVIAKK